VLIPRDEIAAGEAPSLEDLDKWEEQARLRPHIRVPIPIETLAAASWEEKIHLIKRSYVFMSADEMVEHWARAKTCLVPGVVVAAIEESTT
jgi:hypothetical protein